MDKGCTELFDALNDFLGHTTDMKYLLTIGKTLMSNFFDIFKKLNISNKQSQGTNKTVVDTKSKLFGSNTLIELCQKQINDKNFE